MRLFFALWPPAPLAHHLGALAADCARCNGGKATRPDTVHLTLSFLGEIEDDRLARLIDAARSVDARGFSLVIDCLGYWPHKHLLWAGSLTPPPALIDLVARLRTALRAEGFVEDDPTRDFAAHVTLVRRITKPGKPDSPALTEAFDWPVTQFALVDSRRSPAGPAYQRIAVFGLRT